MPEKEPTICEALAADDAVRAEQLSARLKALSSATCGEDAKDELISAAEMFKGLALGKFELCRLQADLWLAAIRQLENRQIAGDDSTKLLGIPLQENELRDAAEEALRLCAHYSDSIELCIFLIDQANNVRRRTWF